MALALLGSVLSILFLRKTHDHQLKALLK